jgi:Na+-driven multidrug efflux pump
VLQLAGPLIISFWLRSLYAWVDLIYASQLPGISDQAKAANGLAVPFEFEMGACWIGASNGLTAHLAAAMGAGEHA